MRHWLFEGALNMQKEPEDPKGEGIGGASEKVRIPSQIP